MKKYLFCKFWVQKLKFCTGSRKFCADIRLRVRAFQKLWAKHCAQFTVSSTLRCSQRNAMCIVLDSANYRLDILQLDTQIFAQLDPQEVCRPFTGATGRKQFNTRKDQRNRTEHCHLETTMSKYFNTSQYIRNHTNLQVLTLSYFQPQNKILLNKN